jgi:aerobic carbon-monoxide dehydrogenase large subunit
VTHTLAPSRDTLVGTRVKRSEDLRLITGRSVFVDDVVLPRMVHAAFVRAPHAHAKVVEVDTAAAEGLPGVHVVFTGTQMAAATSPLGLQPVEGLKSPVFYALATDRVRFVGEPVAIVVADTRADAEDAVDAVRVTYEVLPAVVDAEVAIEPDAPVLFDELEGNELYRVAKAYGDTDAAFAAADRVITERFVQHRYANVPLEGHACLSSFDPASGELTHRSSHQGPHMLRLGLSHVLQLPLHKVRVLCGDVGGAFGSKGHWQREELAAAFASTQLGVPVKWISDRRESLLNGGQTREETVEVSAAVLDDGTLLGLRVKLLLNQGAYPCVPYPTVVFPLLARALMPSAYRIVDYDFEIAMACTNKAAYVAYRGPWETETWVRERLFDVLAAELDIDPAEIRRRNLWTDHELPRPLTTEAATLRDLTVRECLDTVLDAVDYDAFRAEQARARDDGRYLGLGLSCFIEPAPQAIFGIGFDFVRTETSTAQLEPDGSLTIFTSQAPNGQGHQTTIAQVCADRLSIPFEQVNVVHGDTRVTPFTSIGTGASRGATMATGAAAGATDILRDRILVIAGTMLGCSPDELRLQDGAVVPPSGDPLPLAAIGFTAYTVPFTMPPGVETDLRATYTFDYEGGWAQACHCCVVEVDTETGRTEILRYVVAENCGKPIHPGIVDGQIVGGITQGVGAVLYESAAYGDDGQFLAGSFREYLLPTAMEAPRVEIHHIVPEGDDVPSHGVGEGGNIGAPAAVTNAIDDALRPLGVKVREQHLPPSRLLEIVTAARRVD